MEKKEKYSLHDTNSMMQLKNMIRHNSLSDKSDTTESFSSTIDKTKQNITEDNSDYTYDTSCDTIKSPSTISVTNLVHKIMSDIKYIPDGINAHYNTSTDNISADSIKKKVLLIDNRGMINKNNQTLEHIKFDIFIDKLMNKIDRVLATDYYKIIKAGTKYKYRYKMCKIKHDKLNYSIDKVINGLNNYRGFEYISYNTTILKYHIVYIKLDYIWK